LWLSFSYSFVTLKTAVILECVDAEEASEQSRRLVQDHDVELRQLARKIAAFEYTLQNQMKTFQSIFLNEKVDVVAGGLRPSDKTA
jgi:uncharacterized protein YlxW (UPF0749 family)